MGKAGSIFSRKISLYVESYRRDFISNTYSLANILSIMIWILILCVPFIVVFDKGKSDYLNSIYRSLVQAKGLRRATQHQICG